MKLPSVEYCFALFQQYDVPKNIVEHCKKVSEVAIGVAEKLHAKGIAIDVKLVQIGALLHDLMKAVTIKDLTETNKFGYTPTRKEIETWRTLRTRFADKKHESEMNAELIKDEYPELAQFILHEGILSSDVITERDWEEKVIHYADWRVLGTKVVPLEERFADFRIRYAQTIGSDDRKWRSIREAERKAEKEIADALHVQPEKL
ncbi:HDIG domain-containing protein [Candidatus Woesearchaeota archaeon]|nr:HDIG domain-containing protein [Candidatus Woesearchaeota archaeon]